MAKRTRVPSTTSRIMASKSHYKKQEISDRCSTQKSNPQRKTQNFATSSTGEDCIYDKLISHFSDWTLKGGLAWLLKLMRIPMRPMANCFRWQQMGSKIQG